MRAGSSAPSASATASSNESARPFRPERAGFGAELTPCGSEVAVEQLVPETDRDGGSERLPERFDGPGENERSLGPAEPCACHCDALNLEARLEDVPEWERSFEASPVSDLGHVAVARDERAVGQEVVREMLCTRVVVRAGELEQLDRQRLGPLDLAECDEHLADADERARLASAVAEAAAEGETLLECGECTLVVAHVVDEQPAERIQSVCTLDVVAEGRPRGDRPGQSSSTAVDVAEPRRELAGGDERTGAREIVGRTAFERSIDASPSLVEVRVREPEPAERARESQRCLVFSARRQPVERSAQVVVIAREPGGPLGFALQATGVRLLCESGEEARMSVRVDGPTRRRPQAAPRPARGSCRAAGSDRPRSPSASSHRQGL